MEIDRRKMALIFIRSTSLIHIIDCTRTLVCHLIHSKCELNELWNIYKHESQNKIISNNKNHCIEKRKGEIYMNTWIQFHRLHHNGMTIIANWLFVFHTARMRVNNNSNHSQNVCDSQTIAKNETNETSDTMEMKEKQKQKHK